MKEEEIIKKRCGTGNVFRVPDGYFDDFASNLMEKLPERENRTIQLSNHYGVAHILKPILYAAACLCLAIFCTVLYFNKNVSTNQSQNSSASVSVQGSSESSRDELIDRTADYAMMDNHDIYACVSSDQD
jgi:hypothetical protein